MTETVAAPPPPPPPQEAPRKASRTRTIVMLLVGGPVLAVGGCALFLSTMNFNTGNADNAVSTLGAIGFLVGVLAFIVGVLWGVARLIDRRFDKAKQAP